MSLAANLVGITWGLPARWHPDEKADEAALMVSERTLLPRSFINPSLPLYMMMPVVAVQQRLAAWGLLPESLSDPLLAGRLLAALAAAAAVLIIGLWAAPAPSPLAAFFLALAPGFVNLGHFATPEPWLLLATSTVLMACRRHLDGQWSAAALGLLVGLAGATKYTAIALLLPAMLAVVLGTETAPRPARPAVAGGIGLAAAALGAWIAATTTGALRLGYADARLLQPEAAHAFVRGMGVSLVVAGLVLALVAAAAHGKQGWARRITSTAVGILLVAAAGGFLLGTPGALVRPFAFLTDLAFNQQTRTEYKGLVGESTSFAAYGALLLDALTWPLLVLAVLGLLVAVSRALKREALACIWIAAAVAPYLLVATSGHRALRFLAPVFPVTALLAADAVATLITARRTRLLVAGAVMARLAAGAVLVDRLFLVDSRRTAARWLDANVPVGTPIDVITNHTGYAPAPSRHSLRVVPTLSREMAPKDRFEEAARDYPATASPWLVLTESYYQRFLDHPDQHPERARFFGDLLAGRLGFEEVARFRQRGWRRPPVEFVDPEIVVLRHR